MRSTLHSALRRTARRVLQGLLARPAVRERLCRRALDAWDGADSVAFVCFGNICRSPFAEAVARERAPGRRVLSAGSTPSPDRRSPGQAVLAARAWHVDLRPHRSQAFSPELAATADAIFVFDLHNLRKVVMQHPRALKRVHPLGALAPGGPLFISDPFGGDDAAFDRTFEQIAAAIPAAGPRSAQRRGRSVGRFRHHRGGVPEPREAPDPRVPERHPDRGLLGRRA